MYDSIRLSYEYVKEFFERGGCQLLEKEYKNARTPMSYKCVCGNKSKICFDSFRNGNRCKECGNKKNSEKQRYTHEKVFASFKEADCELIDTYERALVPMRYICSCGRKAKISWNNFQQGKRCHYCGVARRSGKNHYEWRDDREAFHRDYLFRQRCYKLVRMVLNVTGRVKNKKTAELLGYDYKQLQEHIMNHPNYEEVKNGKWHIDHIFPIKAFVDFGITDLALINCFGNLRPISAFENISKNAKYDAKKFEKWLDSKGINHINNLSLIRKEVSV